MLANTQLQVSLGSAGITHALYPRALTKTGIKTFSKKIAAPLGWLTPLFALGELLSNPPAHTRELTAWVVKEKTP